MNRLSCGIQSLNQKSLEFVGRRADRKTNIKALDLISSFWKKEYSFDLICGLPYETKESFFDGLKSIISYNPNHISMYSLTLEDETPLGKFYISHEYDYDFADKLWLKAKSFLEKATLNEFLFLEGFVLVLTPVIFLHNSIKSLQIFSE